MSEDYSSLQPYYCIYLLTFQRSGRASYLCVSKENQIIQRDLFPPVFQSKIHGIGFLKIHAPWAVLCREAEIMKLKMPTKKVSSSSADCSELLSFINYHSPDSFSITFILTILFITLTTHFILRPVQDKPCYSSRQIHIHFSHMNEINEILSHGEELLPSTGTIPCLFCRFMKLSKAETWQRKSVCSFTKLPTLSTLKWVPDGRMISSHSRFLFQGRSSICE